LKQDICDITLFCEHIINLEFETLKERGFFDNGITPKGEEIVKLFDIVESLNNNFSVVTDNYLDELYLYDKEKLSETKNYSIYPQRIFDYQLLKKINKYKDRIFQKIDNDIVNKYKDEFSIKVYYKGNYFYNVTDINFVDESDFEIFVPVVKISYDISSEYQNVEEIRKYFKTLYYDLFNGEKISFINKSYKSRFKLPKRKKITQINFENQNVPFEKIALCDIKVNIKETYNTKYIDMISILKGLL